MKDLVIEVDFAIFDWLVDMTSHLPSVRICTNTIFQLKLCWWVCDVTPKDPVSKCTQHKDSTIVWTRCLIWRVHQNLFCICIPWGSEHFLDANVIWLPHGGQAINKDKRSTFFFSTFQINNDCCPMPAFGVAKESRNKVHTFVGE